MASTIGFQPIGEGSNPSGRSMTIKLEKSGNTFRADCLDLPGSPPIGDGQTKEEAVACLLLRMHLGRERWFNYIDMSEPINFE